MAHLPVLLNEVIRGLDPQAGETYLDATVGSGGHALAVGRLLGPAGRIIGLDQDASSLEKAKETLRDLKLQVNLKRGNFRQLDRILNQLEVKTVNKALFDLGVHSDQLGSSGRGFSFLYDEPLVMTMENKPKADKLTARDLVNDWSKTDLANVLTAYGEEQFAEAIAEAIVKARRTAPIETTFQLVSIIKAAVPKWYLHRKIHPATKTFQALRMAVNDELDALKNGLAEAWSRLAPGGRLAVISFHSLEARAAKNYFKNLVQAGAGELITKHASKPTWAETRENPRCRSAQLRVIKKL